MLKKCVGVCFVLNDKVWCGVIKIWIACVEVREKYDVEEVYMCDFCK